MTDRIRCGFGVPLDQLAPGDRQAVDDFRRYLAGEMGDTERAAYEQGQAEAEWSRSDAAAEAEQAWASDGGHDGG